MWRAVGAQGNPNLLKIYKSNLGLQTDPDHRTSFSKKSGEQVRENRPLPQGHLDGVDYEARKEEQQAQREHDEHKRDRHGRRRVSSLLPIATGLLKNRGC
jgi:hypothetical protein